MSSMSHTRHPDTHLRPPTHRAGPSAATCHVISSPPHYSSTQYTPRPGFGHTSNRHPPPFSYPPGVGSSRPLRRNPEVVVSSPPHYSSTRYTPLPGFGSYKQQTFTSGRWRIRVTVLVESQANEIIK